MDKNYTSSLNVALEMLVTHFKNCVNSIQFIYFTFHRPNTRSTRTYGYLQWDWV